MNGEQIRRTHGKRAGGFALGSVVDKPLSGYHQLSEGMQGGAPAAGSEA